MELIGWLTWHDAVKILALGTIQKELGYPVPAELVAAARNAKVFT